MPAIILLLTLFLPLAHLCAAPVSLDEFAGKLAPLAARGEVAAEFVQTRHFKALDFSLTVTGEMAMSAGKSMRWETISPARSRCIMTPDSFQVWDELSGKTTRLKASDYPWVAMVFRLQNSWFSGDLGQLRNEFDIAVLDATSVRMLPRNENVSLFFSEITVHFSEDFSDVRQIVFMEKNSDTITIDFKRR